MSSINEIKIAFAAEALFVIGSNRTRTRTSRRRSGSECRSRNPSNARSCIIPTREATNSTVVVDQYPQSMCVLRCGKAHGTPELPFYLSMWSRCCKGVRFYPPAIQPPSGRSIWSTRLGTRFRYSTACSATIDGCVMSLTDGCGTLVVYNYVASGGGGRGGSCANHCGCTPLSEQTCGAPDLRN